jgi:predicted phage terminase large subunit-like protein
MKKMSQIVATVDEIQKTLIEKELEKRKGLEICKTNLWEYCKKLDDEFFIDEKTLLLDAANKIQLVSEGKIRKLAISMYPRAGKSYLISAACSWMLGNYPTGCIMRNAYGESLANKFSYDIKAMIQKELFRTLFEGVKLSKHKKAVDCWALNKSKQFAYFGSGVGGTTTGYGCNIVGIVDDPIKNMQDAMSPKVLEFTWDWFFSTHRTRYEIRPDTGWTCPEIIISTMWSKDDLINRIIDQEGTVEEGGDWTFVSYPALGEDDKSTCESMMPTERLHKIREECSLSGQDFIWETMYMNNVVQKYGNLFPKNSLTFLEEELFPDSYDAIIGWCDPADRGKNFTCSAIIGIKNGLAYVLDTIYTKKGYEVYKQLIIDQVIKYLPSMYIIEANKDGRIISVEVRNEVEKILEAMRLSGEYVGSVFDVRIISRTESKNKELRIMLSAPTIKSMFVFNKNYLHNSFYGFFIKDLTTYLAEGNNDSDDAADVLAGLASILKPKGNALVEIYDGK